MSETPADLVTRCRAGDRAAEAPLAERAARRALGVAVVAMTDAHAARDVSQEVAVRVLRSLPGLRDPGRFDAWVHRITVSEIRRAHGRRRRRGEVPFDAEGAGPRALLVEDAHGVEMLVARAELRVALADLPARERTALALRYVHDLGDEEIAAAMRCRPGTVRSLLSRGRSRLRAHPALAGHVPPTPALRPRPQELRS